MEKILMEHGSGGRATSDLIASIFEEEFHNEVLSAMEDAAVVAGAEQIAITTDSFVVTPIEFPGGDIGRLCVCGTVNDLLMRGAKPKYLTCGFILQEGADIAQLKRIVHSMADTAKEAGVMIVAGDTKVVEGDGGIFINTTGVGIVKNELQISASAGRAGDLILVSGEMGDHHAAILSSRMKIKNSIVSDNAPLSDMVERLLKNGIRVHTFRDVTRGGLATVLKELAGTTGLCFEVNEQEIPVNAQVRDFCGLLGLDPMYMGNEGKLVAIVEREDGERALELMQNSRYGEKARVIGEVVEPQDSMEQGALIVKTRIGGRRTMDILQGEGLPRIC